MSLHEVEVKAFISDEKQGIENELDEARIRLMESGAVEAGTIQQKDFYLSHPCRDFSETDEAFRIRTQWETGTGDVRTFITYKGPKVSSRSKARVEREVEIAGSPPGELLELFQSLGFSEVMAVEKVRERHTLEEMEISLDLVAGLGLYVEVELGSDEVEKAEDRILAILKKLGWTRLERRSYLELLLTKQV
jgi:adenylate cyclase class 2